MLRSLFSGFSARMAAIRGERITIRSGSILCFPDLPWFLQGVL
jgi:hypothetical protein